MTVLEERARRTAGRLAYTFLADDADECASLTFAQLAGRARGLGAWLANSTEPGDRVLLVLPSGPELVAGFLGCLYARCVAVLAPPATRRGGLERLQAIALDAESRLALTTQAFAERASGLAEGPLSTLRWLTVDAVSPTVAVPGSEQRPVPAAPEALAFLQYTSGSTASPRGVMITHGSLMHNLALIRDACGHDEAAVFVSWLPMFHDLGLIGNVLQALFVGAHCVLLPPAAFLKRPRLWLEAVSRYRATTSGGPNFAYERCLRRIAPEQRSRLDLSSWRVAFNGAEPVRPETLDRFAAAFAPCGFRHTAFYPCYGLAEATLMVTGGSPGAAPAIAELDRAGLERHAVLLAATPAEARRLVGCGRVLGDLRVVIADPETRVRRDGEVGEIWVSGTSVARGYWGLPEASAATFNAFLADGDGPYLRTGDLGVFHHGELLITGRIKDLIIVRGRNLYPQDVEQTAESAHPDLEPGGAAAFGVEIDGEERLVVAQELARRHGANRLGAAEAIRREVSEVHEAQVHEVVLVRTGTLPRTSSGKLRRGACRALYQTGGLAVLARAVPLSQLDDGGDGEPELPPETAALGRRLGELAARVLGVPAAAVSFHRPLTGLGLDSLAAADLEQAIAAELGLQARADALLGGATIAGLAEALQHCTPAPASAPEPPSAGTLHDRTLPASRGQQAIWFLERLAPAGRANVIAVAARLPGRLDVAGFRRCVELLVARHPALRTTFHAPHGEVLQTVHASLPPAVSLVAAEALDEGGLAELLGREAFRPFDLERGPLVRLAFFRRAADDHFLTFSVHHVAADFLSLATLAAELDALARWQAAGGSSASPQALLAPLVSDAPAVLARQQEQLAGPRGERLWSYWREALRGAPASLDLPTDHPRPAVPSDRGGSQLRWLQVGALQSFAGHSGCTPFMLLLAGFQALLGRYSGQRDLLVGSPVAARSGRDSAGLVGFFTNLLPFRATLDPVAGFGELAAVVRRTTLDALAHQELPFASLTERLRPVRDLSRHPLFQVLLVVYRAPGGGQPGLPGFALGLPGARLPAGPLELESVPLGHRPSAYDLSLRLAEIDGELAAALDFRADLFDAATAERLLGHFERLLAGALAEPEKALAELPLLSPAERRQLLGEWNDTAAPLADEQLPHRQIEAQAALRPDAVALVFAGGSWTYRELDARAARLASRLLERGVGPDALVGVCAGRAPYLVAALLAVLKAGGAYVPLDPGYPRERLARMLEDSRPAALLVDERGAGVVPESSVPRLALAAAGGAFLPPRSALPENLAYVIYTSGSTGRPKGVAITLQALASFFAAMDDALGCDPGERVLALTSISFDVSVLELLWPLARGARVLLVEGATPDAAGSPALTLEEAARENPTLMQCTPSTLRLLTLRPDILAALPSVRRLLLGGETLAPGLAAEAAGALGARLFNLYGPTETTVWTTAHPLRPSEFGALSLPLGRPVANCRFYVVDPAVQPVPAGAPGELWIGAAGLARGYYGRPELTAERFVPDPWSGVAGGRLYRTGDLVRHRPDGEIEILGRIDFQVKVRGHRIELQEIEAVITEHPAVHEAVVVLREDAPGDRRLVAFLVAREGGSTSVAELRGALERQLPGIMVPSRLVWVDALPRTPAGKIDRGAVAALERPAERDALPTERPATALEEALADLWRDALGLVHVGVEESFFALGGHSLLLAQVQHRLHQELGVDLPLARLFAAPTIRGQASLLAAAGPAGGGEDPAALPPVPVRSGAAADGVPLSFPQQRFWLLDQLEPGNAAYVLSAALRLAGNLHRPALAAALGEIVRRHEALRTTFEPTVDGPRAVVASPGLFHLPVIDLQGLATPAAETARLAHWNASQPCDLRGGPLLRACLVAESDGGQVLLFAVHHAASDGISLAIFARELTALYRAAVAGAAGVVSPLPEPALQYADYARWQRSALPPARLAGQLDFWRRELAGCPPELTLPTDLPRRRLQRRRGARRQLAISALQAETLQALGSRHGATLFTTLAAGVQAWLARCSGQLDFTLGFPVAGRRRPELEKLIGCFMNTLVLRADLSGKPSFATHLARVGTRALAAQANQDLPFELLVEDVARARDLTRSPLFQVLLELGPAPEEELALADLQVTALPAAHDSCRFDLAFTFAAGRSGLAGAIEYDADLFEAATVDRAAGQVLTLLAGAAAAPQCPLGELPLLTGSEQAELASQWSAPSLDAGELRLHDLVAEQGARQPSRIALEHGGEALSYGELERRTSGLARRLGRLGVGPDALVGIFAARGIPMVEAVLAVLKAGGAYLPLDPAYPEERLRFMVADSRARLVLATAAEAPRLAGLRVPVLGIADLAGTGDDMPGPPPCATAPDHLAYTLYTSGSTGRPKGVQVSHRAAVSLLQAVAVRPGLAAADRLLAVTSLSFDISVLEFFLPLSVGARVVLAPQDTVADGQRLAALADACQATVVQATPATWRLLVDAGWPGAPWLKALCGGESLSRRLADELLGRTGEFWNLYGPTETTVWSTAGRVVAGAGPVCLGGPLAGTRIYVADPAGEPLPLGAVGEVLIGGVGLARGYLGRPDLTADRFCPDPFAAGAGARLYRTGDLGRRLAGGRMELLGRADHQVKVRGYRVELDEVAAALTRIPAVRDAVVVADGEEANRRLAAFFVPAGDARPTAAGLASALRAELPEPMVPAVFVPLPQLPRTPNGKVDRQALRIPEMPGRSDPGRWAPPRTSTEELVAESWREVLGQAAATHDDFFALGGHSLLATQAASRLRQLLGMEVPLRWFFEHRTVAALAGVIDVQRRTPGATSPAEAPQPTRSSRRRGPLSFAQQRLYFLDQLEPGSPLYNLPACIRLQGALSPSALAGGFLAMMVRHESLRTTFTERAGMAEQVVAPRPDFALPLIDLSALPPDRREREAQELVTAEVRRSFDLTRGPLLRARLLRLAGEEHVLSLVVHHIVADFWSLGRMLREISAGYGAADPAAALPPLPLQYLDFTLWHRSWLESGALAAGFAYWRRHLDGLTPLDLPTDRPRPAIEEFRGSEAALSWNGELTAALGTLARREGATIFMVALAGFQTLLHRWSGTRRVAVGSPIANRTRVEFEELIGFFANTLVLVSDLSGNPSCRCLLAQVREVALDAYAHQHVPFERLVEELQPVRDLSQNPLFQVHLAFENAPLPPLALPGVRLVPYPAVAGTAKFQLTLFLRPHQGHLEGWLEFDRDLFEPVTAQRLLGQLERLLTAAAREPELRLWDLPLLSPAELEEVLVTWNRTPAPGLPERCVHRLVEEQAARTPEATALVDGELRLSYAEVNRRAGRLAALLGRRGVGPEVPVGIHVERSWEMVVALLGVLKAGGAAVALDVTYPRERITRIIADSSMLVLLTQRSLLCRLAPGAAEPILLDVDWDAAFPGEAWNRPMAAPEHPMYLIYTSGSTGVPKGIVVPHSAFHNLLSWELLHHPRYGPKTTAQFATFGFCVSFQEVFTTWCSGGTLVLVPEEARRDMESLAALLGEQGVERLYLPFAALKQLSEVLAAGGGPLPRLEEVTTAGEQLQVSPAVRQLFSRLEGACLHNQFGASETHVVSSHTLRGRPRGWPDLPPIGKPVHNVQLYLVDHYLQPVPVGVPGELLAGGACLPRGYVNDPELTAAKLVPDPWSGSPGARLYRTGDLGRYLPGGSIQHLGRADLQLKVRGYRVEPGEIEAVLRLHPAVRDAAVIAQPAPAGGQRLLGYVVLQAEQDAGLAAHLRHLLPEYMVPSELIPLAALPLNANGKLDREALPLPGPRSDRPEVRTPYVAPRGPVEELLALLWEQSLGLGRVGARDNFFELGGHSLLALQLISRVREAFAAEVPLRSLFLAPSVEEMAHALERNEPAPGHVEAAARLRLEIRALPESERQRLLAELRQQPQETLHLDA